MPLFLKQVYFWVVLVPPKFLWRSRFVIFHTTGILWISVLVLQDYQWLLTNEFQRSPMISNKDFSRFLTMIFNDFQWFLKIDSPSSFLRCVQCECNNHGTKCDPETGVCQCTDNTMGRNCELCKTGFYGNPTRGNPDDCQPCPCVISRPGGQKVGGGNFLYCLVV